MVDAVLHALVREARARTVRGRSSARPARAGPLASALVGFARGERLEGHRLDVPRTGSRRIPFVPAGRGRP